MLASSWDLSPSATDSRALNTQAINLPVSERDIIQVQLLLTLDAEQNGLPNRSVVLAEWGRKSVFFFTYLLDLLEE